jgi:hypothetical protein
MHNVDNSRVNFSQKIPKILICRQLQSIFVNLIKTQDIDKLTNEKGGERSWISLLILEKSF